MVPFVLLGALRNTPVLRIARSALRVIEAHAQADAPVECCGLLIGAGEHVHRAVPTRNVRASQARYLVDPQQHFDAQRLAREEGLAVIGAYHSHPASPPVPSETDLREALEIGFLYLIVTPAGAGRTAEARAYRFSGDAFEALDLEVVAGARGT